MTEFKKAEEIAKEIYKKSGAGDVKIGVAFETEDAWFLFRDLEGATQTGSVVARVGKMSGEAELLTYPTRELHKVLARARQIR